MFLALARLFPDDQGSPRPEAVFRVHPAQLSRFLDEAWSSARLTPQVPGPAGDVTIVDPAVLAALDLPRPAPAFLAPSGLTTDPEAFSGLPLPGGQLCPPPLWHHLVYAYLLESTGVIEVFAAVLRRLLVGEGMGVLSPDSIAWARATEQLFFRDPPEFSVVGVQSELRPSARANRRNAYWRMFEMDLPHPVPGPWRAPDPFADWKADTGAGVNGDFRVKWGELLRQIWLGVENRGNSSGANPADPSYIALLCRALRDMMRNRRRGGALTREELAYVSMLSWFHLTVDSDTPVVVDLQAQASSPADRLAAVAQRVGMTPALRSRELFELAEPMATILRAIELGFFDSADSAAALIDAGSPLATDVVSVINNWQSATGERVKERPSGSLPGTSAQPLRVPVPGQSSHGLAAAAPAGAAANGHKS